MLISFADEKLIDLKTIIIDNPFILKMNIQISMVPSYGLNQKSLKENIHCERDLRQARHILLLNYFMRMTEILLNL